MRWIKEYIILIGFLFISCEIVESELNNPLDTDANAEKGIAPPALVFFPDNVTTNTGGNAVVNVYALEVENVAGIMLKTIITMYRKGIFDQISIKRWKIRSNRPPK